MSDSGKIELESESEARFCRLACVCYATACLCARLSESVCVCDALRLLSSQLDTNLIGALLRINSTGYWIVQ